VLKVTLLIYFDSINVKTNAFSDQLSNVWNTSYTGWNLIMYIKTIPVWGQYDFFL